MSDLRISDQSAIGRALARVVADHAAVGLKEQKPILRPYNQPEATHRFLEQLRADGLDVVKVAQ